MGDFSVPVLGRFLTQPTEHIKKIYILKIKAPCRASPSV